MTVKDLKKTLRLKLAESLKVNLEGMESSIKPKKLERNIRRASKLLLAGLKVTPSKKTDAPKKKSRK